MCAIHAKDFVVEEGVIERRLPGEGMLNYRLIFEKMKEHNVDVPIICEEISDDNAVVAFDNLEKISAI